ncbi:hypothetical protein [Pseudomonas jessenii]|uniref:hypothetical protein n=1 Tax=Pseudomonas jessenii TaxID=77298 RepID=UPI0030BDF7FB
MASWKWVLGVGTAAIGIIAAPVADSLVKDGKFPDGLGAVISTLWGWLSTLLTAQVSVPLWTVLLVSLPIGIGLRGLIMTKRQVPQESEPAPIIAQLRQELHGLYDHHAALKATNKQLEAQLVEFATLQESQQSRNAALEVEIVSQRDANADLKQQLAAKPQTPKEGEVDLPEFASKVLNTIAKFVNVRIEPNLILIGNAGAGQLETEGAIDILLEHQMVKQINGVRGTTYNLTPKGRAHYLKQRDKEKG